MGKFIFKRNFNTNIPIFYAAQIDNILRRAYVLRMKNGSQGIETRYRLSSYIVAESADQIVVIEYIFYIRSGVFRQISYESHIDDARSLLLIDIDCMSGSMAGLAEDEIQEQFQSLPPWNKTRYYQFCAANSNIYMCRNNILTLSL